MDIEDRSRQELGRQILELVEDHLEQVVTELFMAVEEEFDVEISPMDEEQLETPADFVEFILRKSGSI